jgi:hypothetical protein
VSLVCATVLNSLRRREKTKNTNAAPARTTKPPSDPPIMAPSVVFGILDVVSVVPPSAVAGLEEVEMGDGIISVVVAMTVVMVKISVLIMLLELCIRIVDKEVDVKEETVTDLEVDEVEVGRMEVDDECDRDVVFEFVEATGSTGSTVISSSSSIAATTISGSE